MTMRIFSLFLILVLGLASGLGAGDPTPRIGGRFDLRDAQTGTRVTQASYGGRVRLVFFGFTHCPLTCPLGLRTIEKVLAKLGEDAVQLQCLFITVDPTRDTAKVMSDYLASFDPRFVGLVGSEGAIHAAMRDFRLEVERVGEGRNYLVEHPAIVYLMGRQGEYLRTFSSGGDPDEIADELRTVFQKGK
jgi:protein SCO1/2